MRFGIRELIFMLVLLAVPLASYMYVFKPRNEEIRLAEKEADTKRIKLNRLREVSSKISDIEVTILQGQQAIDVIERKLPSEQDVEIILEDIWKIAKKEKLQVKSVKTEKLISAAMYSEQPLRIVMEGSFNGFYQFLLDLESLDRITRIHQLKIQRVGGSRGKRSNADAPTGSIKSVFTLSIYFVSNSQ